MRVNYKSDFDFIVNVSSNNDAYLNFVEYDFSVKIRNTFGGKLYEAYHKSGEWKNCFNDNGRLHVVMKEHGLRPGKLVMELTIYVSDEKYPEQKKSLSSVHNLNIELVQTNGDDATEVDVELTYVS